MASVAQGPQRVRNAATVRELLPICSRPSKPIPWTTSRTRPSATCCACTTDIYVSDNQQLDKLKHASKHAAGSTLKIFREADGSAGHCRNGAREQAMQEIVLWQREQGIE